MNFNEQGTNLPPHGETDPLNKLRWNIYFILKHYRNVNTTKTKGNWQFLEKNVFCLFLNPYLHAHACVKYTFSNKNGQKKCKGREPARFDCYRLAVADPEWRGNVSIVSPWNGLIETRDRRCSRMTGGEQAMESRLKHHPTKVKTWRPVGGPLEVDGWRHINKRSWFHINCLLINTQ